MKQVTIIVPAGEPNVSSIMGTFEIFNSANEYWQKQSKKSRIEINIAGVREELKQVARFYSLHPTDLNDIKRPDLVILPSITDPGGFERMIYNNETLITWIESQYKQGAEIASFCTGAFLLAATGLLDGKTCSTHWRSENEFKRLFPKVELQIDKLLIAGNGLYTNGGAFSFLNLVLLLVEKYFDKATAIYCAKVFQIDFDRSSQSPFAIFEPQKNHGDALIIKAQNFIEKNLHAKLSFEKLASEFAVSRRNFDRRFIKATGNTPLEYLQRVKVEVAKNTLEKGRKNMIEIMDEVGYTDDRAFRDVFKRITGLSPSDYRSKYNTGSGLT